MESSDFKKYQHYIIYMQDDVTAPRKKKIPERQIDRKKNLRVISNFKVRQVRGFFLSLFVNSVIPLPLT